MKKLVVIVSQLFIIAGTIYAQQSDFPSRKLSGPYLGQKPPGMTPEIFAPGIVSTGFHEHSLPSFSLDGKEVLWMHTFSSNYKYEFPNLIISMKEIENIWSEPEFVDFNLKPASGGAIFAPDGKRIFFYSNASINVSESDNSDSNIWYIEKIGDNWSQPKLVCNNINTPNHETQPSVTLDNTLYYNGYYEGGKNNYGIYRSRFVNGEYTKPELLPEQINTKDLEWTPYISPDESYLLFSAIRPGGYGSGDLYVSFRNDDDTWSDAINLGPEINKEDNERFPYVSPDGKFLFYITDKVNEKLLTNKELSYKEFVELYMKPGNGWSDIYWVDAKTIEELRPKK